MGTALADYNGVEIFFMICSIVGGIFFVIRLVFQFIGGTDFDTDIDSHAGDIDHHVDTDASFKLLTLHGFTSFMMMFGLVGFAMYRQSTMGTFISIVGGVSAGLVSVWVIGKLFAFVHKLQSSGTMDTMSAVGSEGTVYLTIPKDGTGRVTINFKNRLREYNAVAHNKKEIKTGEQIKVVWVNGNILVVETI